MKTFQHNCCFQCPTHQSVVRLPQNRVLPPTMATITAKHPAPGKPASRKVSGWAVPLPSLHARGKIFCAQGEDVSVPFSASYFHRDVAKYARLLEIFVQTVHVVLFPPTAEALPTFPLPLPQDTGLSWKTNLRGRLSPPSNHRGPPLP